MSWLRNSSVLWAMGLLATLAPACSSTEEATEEDDEGALSTVTISKPGDWVVDMKKVKAAYCGGQSCTSKYFFGLAPHEAGLCKVDAQGQPAAACAAMEQQGLIVWDQAFRYKDDHSLVAPTEETPVVRLEGSEANTSVKGLRLNIIPMLKETDPLDQKHIAEWMQNGDVMVYFHPEQSDQKSLMDRRTSHVAMYYEYKDAQGKVIARHHIDNPNNYGPQFNHSPDRQMPFHIFRYRPKGMSAETSRAVGLNARNWGFITDDRSPFADFFDLRLQTVADLRTFKEKALKGEDIPEVYCSGLAYTNLNLGVNYPLKANMLRAAGYSREETGHVEGNVLKANILAPAETQGLAAPATERLIYEPYTPTELATSFVDNIYAALPPVAEAGKPSRKAIISSEGLQGAILNGFAELQFSDAENAEKRRAHLATDKPVVTPARLKAWADAYALKASDTAAWLGRNAEIKAEVESERIATADKAPMQVLRDLEVATVKNKFVGPRIWLDEADHRQWAADPRMLPVLPAKGDVDMIYVGTVVNCDILTAADGSRKSACAGFGGKLREWKEGGADTSTYDHYAVANGRERTHRRFDASPFSNGIDENRREIGERSMGQGTQVSVRASTKESKDLMFVFHTPEMNGAAESAGGLKDEWKALNVKDYDKACTKLYREAAGARATCAPKRGVLLETKDSREVKRHEAEANGEQWDTTFTFDLVGPNGVCKITSDTKMKCPVVEQGAEGWRKTGDSVEISRVIPKKKAFVSMTMVDKGAVSTASAEEIYNCPACKEGGAHFNQWTIKVRDD